ncbi:type I restriction enzyme HsdR N-terminal domain-containing protein [Rossellomorea marisflavi]|uniref:type I restriction enzyme HsdR N-terminal domain-containing protein n=1 Tax=Rossellomorea marisflavi TaxID=189381 RepID=UPI0039BED395
MDELQIALIKVKPALVNTFKFPQENIQGYGRVPIQIGSKVVWADFVLNYFDKFHKKRAFCVIEVKKCSDSGLDFAAPQAESYAQRLNAPFFCCTNGDKYVWYMTGKSQGESLELENSPTLLKQTYMNRPDKLFASPYLYEAINNFESHIITKGKIYEDSVWHHESTLALNKVLKKDSFNNQNHIVDAFDTYTMKSRGKEVLLRNIRNDFCAFKKLLYHLTDQMIPIETRIMNTTGKGSKYGIDKGGIFFISQLLAALYPEKYTVIQPTAINAIKRFQITDIDLKGEGARDYLYFNQICLDLFPLFENPFNFNLSYVHNFLWHYESDYIPNKQWI